MIDLLALIFANLFLGPPIKDLDPHFGLEMIDIANLPGASHRDRQLSWRGIGAERAGWSFVSEMGTRVNWPAFDQKPSWLYGVNRAFTCVSLSVAPSPFRP